MIETSFSGLPIFWAGLAVMYLFLGVLSGIKYREVRCLGGALVVHKNEKSTGISIGSRMGMEVRKEELLKKGEKVRCSVDVGGIF